MIGNKLNFQIQDQWAHKFDYVDSGLPLKTINPPYPNMSYLDKDSGLIYHCTDNTIDNNFWNNVLGE